MTLCSEWFAGEWFCMVECVSERVVVSGKKGSYQQVASKWMVQWGLQPGSTRMYKGFANRFWPQFHMEKFPTIMMQQWGKDGRG